MGKALVFSGITITDPLETVTFSDGISATVRQYIGKLSTVVSDAKTQAFQTFYETLNNSGIWSKITLLYPMFGSVADCAHGMIGADLTIPNGAVYDKGLDLTNASGGYGNAGKGVKLLDYFPSSGTTDYSMFVNYPKAWAASQRGYALVFASDATREAATTSGRFLGNYYTDSSWMNIRMSLATVVTPIAAGTKGLMGETHDFSTRTHIVYINGIAANTVSGEYSSVDNRGGLGINASAQADANTHLLNVPINMVVICNGNALSASEAKTLSDAVEVLSNVIFD